MTTLTLSRLVCFSLNKLGHFLEFYSDGDYVRPLSSAGHEQEIQVLLMQDGTTEIKHTQRAENAAPHLNHSLCKLNLN